MNMPDLNFSDMLENSLDMITCLSSEGSIQYVSPVVRSLLGYHGDELIGRPASELVHPEDLSLCLMESDREILSLRVLHQLGHYIWIEASVSVIRDREGNRKSLFAIARDFTRRKNFEDSLVEAQRVAMLGSWEWSRKDNSVTVSNQLKEMFGDDLSKVNQPSDFQYLIHPEDQARYIENLNQSLAGEKEFNAEFRQLREDGSIRYFHFRMMMLREDEIPIKIQGSTQDITARKLVELQLQESVERYTSLKKYNHDAIISFSLDGSINHGNNMCERMTGYSISELIGKSLSILIGADNLKVILSEFNKDPTVEKRVDRIYQKNGQPIEVLTSVAPIIINNKNVGFYIIVKDMTEEKKLIIEKETAEKTNEAKTQFLAMMSHEIRTPMNAIIGLTDLLMETTELDTEQIQLMQIIRKSGNTLLSIINDILDFSKIESGKMDLNEESLNVALCIEETIDILMPKARSKQLKVRSHVEEDVPSYVCGDHEKLKQVLINLMGNAVKFTEEGSVDITTRLVSQTAEHIKLEFTVKDTGIGIPVEKASNLFEPFYQLAHFTRKTNEGTGLGLAISRKLVELMGGEIHFEPSEVGATFRFTIVFKREVDQEESYEVPESIQEAAQNLKILVAEDNKVNQFVLIKMLEKQGYPDIDIVNDGKGAVEAILNNTYDLVFMDVNMPVMDGLEAARVVKKSIQNKKCPIIIGITANALKGDKEKCIEAGMDDYISKPISSRSISDILQKFVNL